MKKFNGIIYCLLSLAFFSSCDSNKKLEQTDAENAVKDFVQTNSFQSDAIWGLEGYFNVNSITLIEPIIQFTDIEAYLIVHFNYHDAYTNGNMCLRFNFKRNIDKNWILTSVDSVSEVSSQIMSDKLQKWQTVNQFVTISKRSKANNKIVHFIKKQVVDIDGNVYNTVKIGKQVWMVEDLKTTKLNDGTEIPLVRDGIEWKNLTTPCYCFYDNDAANKNKFGALYNWYTVNTGKLAPAGWHVPTDEEWTTLENYLIANGFNYDGTTTDNKIAKSLAASIDWNSDSDIGNIGNDLAKNNSSGFAGLPSGFRSSSGIFYGIGSTIDWWCSTETSKRDAWHRSLYNNRSDESVRVAEKQYGFSVRCIRDN